MRFNPEAVAAARLAAGLSKPALAKVSSLALRTVYNLESGKVKSPDSQTVQRLAAATGVDWSYFFAPVIHKDGNEAV